MRATGESESTLECPSSFWLSGGGCGELRRTCIGSFGGLLLGGGCDVSSSGGAAGNLKLCEKEFEGFRPVADRAGVLGVVVTPGRLPFRRARKAKSVDSWLLGEEASPESGEGCVADRWPGEATTAMSAK